MELSPDRNQAREQYRQQISQIIAGLAVAKQVENPMLPIGLEDEYIS